MSMQIYVCMIVFECVVGGCVCLCVFVFVLTCVWIIPPLPAPPHPTPPHIPLSHKHTLLRFVCYTSLFCAVMTYIACCYWLFLCVFKPFSRSKYFKNMFFFKTTHLVLLIHFLYLWCMVSTTVDIYVTPSKYNILKKQQQQKKQLAWFFTCLKVKTNMQKKKNIYFVI